MKKIFQIFILIFAFIFVGILGFYAYKLSTDTLVFAFKNTQNQSGDTLILAVDRPGFLSRVIPAGRILDEDILLSSVFYNDKKIAPEEMENFEIMQNESFFSIKIKNPQKGDVLRFSSTEYNKNKRTSYNIPQDIVLEYSEEKQNFIIDKKYDFKNRGKYQFLVETTYKIEDISWYLYYPIDGEKCNENGIYWDIRKYESIKPNIVSAKNSDGKILSEVYLDANIKKKNRCILAGISNHIIPVVDENIPDFSMESSLLYALNPDDNLLSQIHFTLHSPIIPDFDEKSAEYEKWEQDLKKEMISKINISPSVEILPENIIVWKKSIDIIGDFEAGREYAVHLSDISDIYGRQISHKFSFIPQNNSFFALYSDEKFANISDAKVQILSTNTHKGIYELKMCRLDVESFFQISEIISEKNTDKIGDIYDMMNSEHASNCVKNNLEVTGKQNQKIVLNEFFEWEKKTGLYIVALRNLEDAQSFENPVFPVVFSVGNIDISAISDYKKLQIFLQNTNNPPYNLTFFPKNPEKNSETGNYFSTGVTFSSDKNIFEISFDDIKKQFQTRDFIVSVRDNSDFWYLYFTLPEEKKFLKNTISSIDNRIFLLWEKIKIFAELPFWEFPPEKTYILELYDEDGKIVQNTYMKPNQFGVFEWDFDTEKTGKIWKYVFSIFEENNGLKEKISENIFFIAEEKSEKNISISLRGLNFENNSPKNLREKANADEQSYYKNMYFAPIQIEAIIEGEKSSSFANTEFSYKIFKKKIAKNTEQELLLESKWKITENGKWYVVFSDEFETFHHDYEYIFEVTMSDILTGEEYTSTSSFIVALPPEYKTFDDFVLPEFVLHSDLIAQGEKLQVQLKNDEIMKNLQKYQYEIFQNIDAHSVLVTSGSLNDLKTDISLDNFSAWEYKIQISPLFENIPESLKISKNFWIEGKDFVLPTSLSIFSRENADKNELFIASPYQTGSMLIVHNTGENINTEVISYTGGSIKYNIENNANILLQIVNISENKEKSESISRFFPAKIFQNLVISDFGIPERMKKWEEMKLDFSLQNLEKKWVLGEVWLEIKKKDEKYFSYKDIFINHKDIYTQIQTNSQIFSQEKIFSKNEKIMQNTPESIVYSDRISTDKNGKISKNIPLDVNSGVYEILIFGYDIFGNKTEIRKDFSVFEDISLSAIIPDLVYSDDKIALQVAVQNHTPEIAMAQFEMNFSHPTHPLTMTGNILLNTFSSDERNFEIKIPKEWKGSVDYALNLKKWDSLLASQSGNIIVDEIPTIGLGRKILGVTTEVANLLPSSAAFLDTTQSRLSLHLARNWSVMIPGLLTEFENITTFSSLDEIRVEFAKKLANSRGFEAQFDMWKITKNIHEPIEISEQILDEWYYIFSLKSLSADIPPVLLSQIENYFSENAIKKFDTFSWKNAIQVKILKLASLLQSNVFDEIFSKISPESLSENEFLEYLEAMQNMKKTANDDIINRLVNSENAPQDSLSDTVYYLKKAYILLWFDKRQEAEKILKNFYEQRISDVSGIEEKLWRLQVALRHAEKSPNSTINAKMVSGNISAKTLLDVKNPLQFWDFERDKIREKIELTSERKFPLYYEFSEKNFLEAPGLFLEKSSEYLRITTNIEKIHENAGMNENNEFALREEISENILQKNTLYKAKITILVQNTEGKKSEDVIVKIFLPNFAEVYIPQNQKNFEIVGREKNAIFLIAKKKEWDRELNFSYYFRPNKSWIYLLPASFVYFSEAREFFANSSHNYFHIQ